MAHLLCIGSVRANRKTQALMASLTSTPGSQNCRWLSLSKDFIQNPGSWEATGHSSVVFTLPRPFEGAFRDRIWMCLDLSLVLPPFHRTLLRPGLKGDSETRGEQTFLMAFNAAAGTYQCYIIISQILWVFASQLWAVNLHSANASDSVHEGIKTKPIMSSTLYTPAFTIPVLVPNGPCKHHLSISCCKINKYRLNEYDYINKIYSYVWTWAL